MDTGELVLGFIGSGAGGALVMAFVNHFLRRRNNEAELADKAVETAERMLARYEAALEESDEKLDEAELLIARLRGEVSALRREVERARARCGQELIRCRTANRKYRAELLRRGWRPNTASEGT